MNIFIINGGQRFAHSNGGLNSLITEWDHTFFQERPDAQVRTTNVSEPYDAEKEVENFVWADLIIYHFPIWWFGLPHGLKEYLDRVLTAGHRKGLYYSDGRKTDNPDRNYGTGGLLAGRHYLATTTWNAPAAAFTLEGEFFDQHSVDQGVLFGFHKMNAFLSLTKLDSFHFHDVEKNLDNQRLTDYHKNYLEYLEHSCARLTPQKTEAL